MRKTDKEYWFASTQEVTAALPVVPCINCGFKINRNQIVAGAYDSPPPKSKSGCAIIAGVVVIALVILVIMNTGK